MVTDDFEKGRVSGRMNGMKKGESVRRGSTGC